MAETATRKQITTTTTTNESEAHLFIALSKHAYGVHLFEGTNAQDGPIAVATSEIPAGTDNFEGALLAAIHGMKLARETLPCVRSLHFHTNERSIVLASKHLPQWRRTGVFLSPRGKALRKEAQWRNLVDALGDTREAFHHAANYTPERARIAKIATALTELRAGLA